MTILVTGGTGVVGSEVVRHLLSTGEAVRVLARSDAAARTINARGATAARGDLLDPPSLSTAVEGCTLVYHVGGVVEFCPRDPGYMFDVNVGGTRNIIEACRRREWCASCIHPRR